MKNYRWRVNYASTLGNNKKTNYRETYVFDYYYFYLCVCICVSECVICKKIDARVVSRIAHVNIILRNFSYIPIIREKMKLYLILLYFYSCTSKFAGTIVIRFLRRILFEYLGVTKVSAHSMWAVCLMELLNRFAVYFW